MVIRTPAALHVGARLLRPAVATVALAGAALLAACGGGGDGPGPVTPTAVRAVDAAPLTGVVGTTLASPVRVRVSDADGRPAARVVVTWSAGGDGRVSPGTSTTNADGVAEASWTLGTAAGAQELVATVAPQVAATVTATATPDRPSAVRLSRDTTRALVPGAALALTAQVVDRYGNAIPGAAVQWATSDAAVATVDAAGVLVARAPGQVTVTATAESVRGELAVTVDSIVPLAVTRVTPATLTPGAAITIEGTGFVTTPGLTSLAISGVAASLTEVTPTRITAVVPPRQALPCEPAGAGRVTVRRALAATPDSVVVPTPVDVALAQPLGVGESVSLTDASAAACLRLAEGGRYVVSVFNAGTDRFASPASVRLRGVPAAGTAADAAPAAYRLAPAAARALTAAQRATRGAAVEHDRLLENDRAVVARLGSPVPGLDAWRRGGRGGTAPRLSVAASAAVPSVGDTVTLTALYTSCSRGTAVRARVVYVGARSVVYEDVASPRAGQMDAEYRQVGEEFDRVQYPILERYFGNPLAMDARLDNDGRIAMLFTKFVNDSVPNVIGYITSCNFYGPAQAPASNQKELFYARVPRTFAGGVPESLAEWRRNVRSTVIHEVKHLTAYGERFARSTRTVPELEEPWLEESTARLAEEFYARTFSGAAWKGNAAYASTIACEVVPCAGDDRPRMMIKHYEALADFYARVGTLTPLGAVGADNSYYGSGWLLVRWAIDHYADDEATFVRALTTETAALGLDNLARRTGRPGPEMLADWTLALAADDRPGLTPRRTQLSFPSWDTRDVFRRLNGANPLGFPRPFPLLVQQVGWGSFTVEVPTVRAWSAGFVELAGAASGGAQLLELRGGAGAPLAPGIGVAILRVQ